jgi:hypothetical protein
MFVGCWQGGESLDDSNRSLNLLIIEAPLEAPLGGWEVAIVILLDRPGPAVA